MESWIHELLTHPGLKYGLLAAGAILVAVSGDEHRLRRLGGLASVIAAQWCH